MLKIAVVTRYFPSSAEPWQGQFAYQTLRVLARGADVQVFSQNAKYPSLLSLGDMVELKGFLPQREALALMNETDYVLLINQDPLNVGSKFTTIWARVSQFSVLFTPKESHDDSSTSCVQAGGLPITISREFVSFFWMP